MSDSGDGISVRSGETEFRASDEVATHIADRTFEAFIALLDWELCTLGHPFAATGTRIVATLAKILDENGGGRGLISICAAGGQGVTAILEKP